MPIRKSNPRGDMGNRILINASNLHAGGGIQVASSFITELFYIAKYSKQGDSISVICSDAVNVNLGSDFDKSVFEAFNVINVMGISKVNSNEKKLFDGFHTCFTVFGPFYFKPNCKKHICGFAQPWIAYPDNVAYPKLPFKEYIKYKIKFKIQSLFFRRYEHLIVEQKHVKYALGKLGYNPNNISVVSNCVSSIYDDNSNWLPLTFEDSRLIEDITLGFIGRAYPHKNLSVLTEVNEILIAKYQMKCNFLFTFSKAEMKSCGFSEHRNFHSVGEISSRQCPAFYKRLNALVFPSLLECFSASPIEAMKMNTTVIASDYPFVKEVCGEAAFYFDPLSADEIAASIFNVFTNKELREEKKALGRQLVNLLPTAKDRAVSYLNIIRDNI